MQPTKRSMKPMFIYDKSARIDIESVDAPSSCFVMMPRIFVKTQNFFGKIDLLRTS